MSSPLGKHPLAVRPIAFLSDIHGHLAPLEAVAAERCTALYGVPTMFIAEMGLADFEAFDLQVVLRMSKAEVALVFRELRVVRNLPEHPLVKLGVAAGHAGFKIRAAAHRAVHEESEVHRG